MSTGQSAFLQSIERARERISSRLTGVDSTGLFRQLVLNETVDPNFGGMLRLVGFVHLLSATGIHLYAVADVWSRILLWLARILGVSSGIAIPAARVLSSFSWLIAWALAGGRMGMLRPLLIVFGRSAATTVGFRWRRWSPLILALLFDFAVGLYRNWPMSPLAALTQDHGRWIYALAVGGGMVALGAHSNTFAQNQKQHLKLAIGSWIFVALWEGWKDGLIATATPVLSYLTIPLFATFVYPALLFSSIAHTLDFTFSLDWLRWISELLSLCTGAVLQLDTLWLVPREALVLGSLLALAGIVVAQSRWIRNRGVQLVLICLLAFLNSEVSTVSRALGNASAAPLASTIEQLDIGQGDAALVRGTDGRNGLIDTGADGALRDEAWIKLLAKRGITSLDWIALSHFDQDHSRGILQLARIVNIHCVASSPEEIESKRGSAMAAALRSRGIALQPWSEGCVPFPTLGPDHRSRKPNGNMSAVFVPLAEGGFYLAAGDAEKKDETRFARWAKQMARESAPGKRILKLSHHGARTSTSEQWLQIIEPTETWISAGVGNRYGHPSPETLETVEKFGASIRRTDEEGVLSSLRAADARRRRPEHLR